MAGLYDGHILEQALLRVDCFTGAPKGGRFIPSLSPDKSLGPPRRAPNAQLYLLTHVHSDHLTGLTEDFTGLIVCTPDTKRMLLRLEYELERDYARKGIREKPRRKYAGLARKLVDQGTPNERIVDRIQTIEYGETRTFDLGYLDGLPVQVNITPYSANHCAGSAMFLIEDDDFAVLHTGDVRADAAWLKALLANPHPALAPFLHDPDPSSSLGRNNVGLRRLDRIYLDTSAFVGTSDMPQKDDVIRELVARMELYPSDTVFYLNTWTWGWEDILKRVSSAFDMPVCVDRYKQSVYKAVHSDPELLACTTRDPHATRLHACERYDRCLVCGWRSSKMVVNVAMVEVKAADYEITKAAFLAQLGDAACGEGDWPTTIECPFARHSPLPELQDLVRVFNPRSLLPNTLQPPLRGLDYYLLPELFDHCLSREAVARLTRERDDWFKGKPTPTMANLVMSAQEGKGADDIFPSGMNSPIGRGRRSHAADHASRLILTPQNLNSTLANLPPDIAEGIRQALEANKFGGALGMIGPSRRRDDEGYDTDEERQVVRRRRARNPSGPVDEVKPDVDLDIWTKLEHSETSDVPVVSTVQEGWMKVEAPMAATPGPSSQTPKSSRHYSPFLRSSKQEQSPPIAIKVDKGHLRKIISAPCPE